MKARFALDLTNDAVALLERGEAGWLRLGQARFDDPDLEGRLGALRAMAEERAPTGFVTKLIIPNSQILYFECQVTGPDQATRRAEIRATLDGRTPYKVDELVFDFSRAGDRARVAVVARITLEEAEDFARAYGFRPVAHVATPEADSFAGEPFFGLIGGAGEHMPEGARYDRDQDPVRTIGALEPVGQAMVGDAAFEPVRPVAAEDNTDQPPPAPGSADVVEEAPFVEIIDHEGEADDPSDGPRLLAVSDVEPDSLLPIVADGDDGQAEIPADDLRDVAGGLELLETQDDKPAEAGVEDLPLAAAADEQDLPAELAFADAELPREDAESFIDAGGPAADGEGPPGDGGDWSTAEESARSAADGADAGIESVARAMQSVDTLDDAEAEANADALQEQVEAAGDAVADLRAAADVDAIEPAAAAAFQSRRKAELAASEDADTEPGARLAAILPRLGGTRPTAAVPDAMPQKTGRTGRLSSLAADTRRAGATGLSGVRRLAERGRRPLGTPPDSGFLKAGLSPKLLVPLAGALAALLFLAWVLIVGSGPDAPPGPANEVTAAAPQTPLPASEPTTGANARPVDLPRPVALAESPTAVAAVQADVSASHLVSAEAASPGASSAGAVPAADALMTDRPLAAPPLAPPFGTLLRYGPDGLIVATPEGVLTPDGYRLVAGRPSRVPPARPDGLVPAMAPAADPATPTPEAEAEAPFADPALKGKRPRARPANLVIPAPALPADETALPAGDPAVAMAALPPLAPPVDPRHSARKPKARPDTVAAAVEASLAGAAAADAALASASKLAVASSRRPAPRSAAAVAAAATSALVVNEPELTIDNGAVEAALAEAQASEPVADEAPADTANANDIDEPEPEEGIANMPTTRTVAKKSTFANAIDLGDIQLIGVYGSSSNRRALVRMPSGGMKKVQLGDRLDGGRVVAIGPDELVYEKKGRTIRLVIMGRG